VDSLEELRKTVLKHQKHTEVLKTKFRDLRNERARGKVGTGVNELCELAEHYLELQCRELHSYLKKNYSDVEARAPILPIAHEVAVVAVDLLIDEFPLDEVNFLSLLASPAFAYQIDGRALKFFYTRNPRRLPALDALLGDRREQDEAYWDLVIGLKILEQCYRLDPRGVSELFIAVGKMLGDALANIKVPVEQFCEAVISIVASILQKIWEWTVAGENFVQWIEDKAPEVQEFVAELADLIGQLYPTITEVIGQNGFTVGLVMQQIFYIVVNIRATSRIKLEELEISETD
jgi:hypothetical protein